MITRCKNCPVSTPANEVRENLYARHLSCAKHILEGDPDCKDCRNKLAEFAKENNIHLVGL